MALLYRLQDFRVGRAWNAVREDELAAAANGINTVTTKLLAFALGATTAGLAGVFNASKLSLVSPDQFQLHRVVHRPGHGHPGRHGQHLGRRGRGLHRLPDPDRPAQAAEHSSRTAATCRRSTSARSTSTSTAIDFLDYPVPALRPGPGVDDAVPTGGPVPEPAPAARTAHRRRDRQRQDSSESRPSSGRSARRPAPRSLRRGSGPGAPGHDR